MDSQFAFRRRRKPGKAIALGIVVLCILTIAALSSWLLRPVSSEEKVVSVQVAGGLTQVASTLKENGVIRSPFAFKVYAVLTGASDEIKAGNYAFTTDESVSSVLQQLKTGKRGDEVTVRIIEGWKQDQVIDQLEEKGFSISKDDLNTALTTIAIADAAGAKKYTVLFEGVALDAKKPLSAEGYIYPDTYKVFANATAEELVRKMLDNMIAKISEEDRAAIAASNYSFYQMLTLSSVVEKEVAHAEDRAVVAGIFWNRLNTKYPLQSDATVNYVTGKKDTTPSAQDLATQSAYNTYQKPGLPPTPISNPSISSIRAVLHPEESEYFFFLTTPAPENKAIFSKTYEEHLRYKAEYYPK